MLDRLLLIKQTQTSSVAILADFFCPLSLEVMTDPVIVSSGQTYEKAFIKRWIDLGLKVCPKTRQTLTLIPNYTVKALIANWCETHNVKLPDPNKSTSLNEISPLLSCTGSIPNMNADFSAHRFATSHMIGMLLQMRLRSPCSEAERVKVLLLHVPASVSNDEFPRADVNENSEDSAHATPCSSDASGEI